MSGFCTLFAVSCQPRHQGGTLGSLTDPFLLQDSESRSSFRPFPTDSHRPVLNRVHCRTTPVAQLLRTGRSPPVALHGHITAPQLLSVTNGRTPVGWGLPPHHVDAFTGALELLALRGVAPRRAAQPDPNSSPKPRSNGDAPLCGTPHKVTKLTKGSRNKHFFVTFVNFC